VPPLATVICDGVNDIFLISTVPVAGWVLAFELDEFAFGWVLFVEVWELLVLVFDLLPLTINPATAKITIMIITAITDLRIIYSYLAVLILTLSAIITSQTINIAGCYHPGPRTRWLLAGHLAYFF
jgi:hypothetical protein